jgi:myo-inositol-1-phosphate synthase
MKPIKLAIVGVGNCASALVQGIEFYRTRDPAQTAGVLHPEIGGYRLEDIQIVCAFDIDARKVGRPLEEAILARPNCTQIFQEKLPAYETRVQMGPVLDGVASHMANYDEDRAFRAADAEPVDVALALRDSGAEVLACYLPVGSEDAARHYAEACLEAGVALVNCVPVFIASDPLWAERFEKRGLRAPDAGPAAR